MGEAASAEARGGSLGPEALAGVSLSLSGPFRLKEEQSLNGLRLGRFIGPYASGLTLAVAPLAAAHGKILWNHGGASDAIFQGGWRYLVSVPSPASDYIKALPLLVRSQDPSIARMSVVHAKTGSFAAYV